MDDRNIRRFDRASRAMIPSGEGKHLSPLHPPSKFALTLSNPILPK